MFYLVCSEVDFRGQNSFICLLSETVNLYGYSVALLMFCYLKWTNNLFQFFWRDDEFGIDCINDC